ncbi:MAG: NfeD family protein [Kiritimatiellae bacterium]|nr:NfeD family protein [Kiritimatiellia bacterium]MBP5226612.1 NfeD family protein [Kiritimatiellia bacterium]
MTFSVTVWILIGLGLAFLELLTPGFVVLFFGLSAITVGLLKLLFPDLGFTVEMLIFSGLSIAYILVLRKWVKRIFLGDRSGSESELNEFVGRQATVVEAIDPPREGRIEVNGATWKAMAERALPVGQTVKIIAQDNLTLKVEAVD